MLKLPPILEVWRLLGGGALRGNRSRAFWRDGVRLSVSLDAKRGSWRDFATGSGGGILALIQTVLGCSKREAVNWLRTQFGPGVITTEPGNGFNTGAVDRAWRAEADRVAAWARETYRRTMIAKRNALKSHLWKYFERLAQREFFFQTATPEQLLSAYRVAMRDDPGLVELILRWEAQDREFSETLVEFVVERMAREQEDRNVA